MDCLILHPGALGDLVLSLPAIASLRSAFPGMRVTLAANVDFAEVVARGYAERVLSLSLVPLHRLRTGDPLGSEDLAWWMSFDRIVSWTGAGDAEYERRMADLHPAALVAPWRPRPGEREHVSALFVKSLEPWLRPGTPLAAPRVSLPAESLAEAQDWLRRRGWSPEMHLLAVHPGAGSPAKRRPLADFVRLGRRWLRQERRGILVIEGPAEPGLAGELARELAATPVIHAAQLPLGRLAAVLSHCSCYSGSDSGISHLAAALGLRTQVWFNATDPAVWRPLASHVSSASSLPAHLRSLLPTGRG